MNLHIKLLTILTKLNTWFMDLQCITSLYIPIFVHKSYELCKLINY